MGEEKERERVKTLARWEKKRTGKQLSSFSIMHKGSQDPFVSRLFANPKQHPSRLDP